MCTEETRQEIVFLLAFQGPHALTRVELADGMEAKLAEVEWPAYLLSSPRTLDALLKRAIHAGRVKKVSPFRWSIEPKGEDRIAYIIDRFVPVNERERLRKVARILA